MEKLLCIDNTPTPIKAVNEPMISALLSFFLPIKYAIKGTITTFVAVRKALFDGVVYLSPIICNENPKNNAIPSIEPYIISSLRMVLKFFHAKAPIIILAIKNL